MRYHASPLEPPRKLRISRGRRSQPRCAACALPPPDCICAELRLLTLETRVVVFLHRREVYKTTNTAQLVPLTLSHSSLHIVGLPEDRVHYRDLEDPTRTTLLLSPTCGPWLCRYSAAFNMVSPTTLHRRPSRHAT